MSIEKIITLGGLRTFKELLNAQRVFDMWPGCSVSDDSYSLWGQQTGTWIASGTGEHIATAKITWTGGSGSPQYSYVSIYGQTFKRLSI